MSDISYVQSQTLYTRFDALFDLARKLPMLSYQGRASGHVDSVSITDTTLPSNNGMFNGGTLFLWYVVTAVLTKHIALVSDHTGNTLTYAPGNATFTDLDTYAVFNATFPHWQMASAIGNALRDIGDIPVTHIITTTANKQEYTLADLNVQGPAAGAALQGFHLVGVEVADSTSAPYNYAPHYHWDWKQNFTGGMTLCFDTGHIPAGGRRMRLTYMVPNKDLDGQYAKTAYLTSTWWESAISPMIEPERLSWQAAVYALRWKVGMAPEQPMYATMLNEAIKRAEELKVRFPVPRPSHIHQSKWLVGR
jgi:hypothetical protein